MVLLQMSMLLIYTLVPSVSLECRWQVVDNNKLQPYIQTGTIVTSTASTHHDCRQQCMQQTTFLCAAYNYESSTEECELLAESDQTATAEPIAGWKYYIRPSCAGLWLPWQAARGMFFSGGDRTIAETDDLRTCMSNCLTTNGTSCRSILKTTSSPSSSASCRLVDKRSDDEGVETRESTVVQYFDRPAWYLDNSPGATQPAVEVIAGRGGGSNIFLLVNKVVPVGGYLVAWQYFVGKTADEACESYAAIWRHDERSAMYRRIVETRITPDHTTVGIKFQYVQDSVTEVKAGDFLGIHVVSHGSCEGNFITFTENGAEDVLLYRGADKTNRPETISSTGLSTANRYLSIRAYIAAYLTLEMPSTNHITPLSLVQIRLTWQLPTDVQNMYQPESAVVRVECSRDSNFTSLVDCNCGSTLLEESECLLYIAVDVRQPYYARLDIVRNYNGVKLLQNPDSPYYLVNGGNPFCLEREMLPDNKVDIEESGVLTPGSSRTITVTIPSISSDDCVSSVKLTYETGTLANQDKMVSWVFTNVQEVTFTLTIYLQLVDGYESVVWNRNYTTSHAPAAPTFPSAGEITTNSAVLSWLQPPYIDPRNSISGYQIACTFPDGNGAIEQTTPGVVYSYKIKPLLSRQQYICTVTALLTDGGYGEISVPVTFTTLDVSDTDGTSTSTTTSTSTSTTSTSAAATSSSSPALPQTSTVKSLQPTSARVVATTPMFMTGAMVGGIIAAVVVCVLVAIIIVVAIKRRTPAENPVTDIAMKPELSRRSEVPVVAVRPTPSSVGRDSRDSSAIDGNAYINSFRAIPVSELSTVIAQQKHAESAFKEEYKTIGNPPLECLIGREPANAGMNRFKNITATDTNRVVLDTSAGYRTDYINANYIMDYRGDSSFIASQGPLPGTIEDMWRMIHDTKSSIVVMLTNPVEATKNKCAVYWPESTDTPAVFGQFEIRLSEEQRLAEFVVRKLVYKYKSTSRTVKLFHFTQWPDHGVPTTTGLLNFRYRVKHEAAGSQSPVIVHCSAGVGRTGTFIGLDILIDEARDEGKRLATVNIMSCVLEMRKQRTKMIQTHEQYAFLYEVLAEALACGGDTAIVCSQFSKKMSQWSQRSANRKSVLEEQFVRMKAAEIPDIKYSIASAEENINKNRDRNILSLNEYRVFIPPTPDHTDYINAVYCNGYYNRNGLIVTQTPLPRTVEHFWTMIFERQSSTILYFNDCKEQPYWPRQKEMLKYGDISVECVHTTDTSDGFTKITLHLTRGQTTYDVTLTEVKLSKESLPAPYQLITLCHQLEKYATTDGDIITVQCSNGSRLSGIFVVAMNLFLRARIEQEVDIVLEVKLARRSRPQFIPDYGSFQFLYKFVSAYVDDFAEYSNLR